MQMPLRLIRICCKTPQYAGLESFDRFYNNNFKLGRFLDGFYL